MADGFLNRWSRRKAEQESLGEEVKAQTPAEALAKSSPDRSTKPKSIENTPDVHRSTSANRAAPLSAPLNPVSEAEALPQLTLVDVEKLDLQGDFSVFMQSGVDPDVQRAAMKKLFSDPRYNIMDGLDIYIDDYSKPDPIPPEMLRRLVQSKMLNLFKAEEETKDDSPEDSKEKIVLEVLDKGATDKESTTISSLESKKEVTEIQPSKPPLDPQLKT
ncbi:Protein of unknown function DUF3306 [Burkholderiaceae bacterium]|jgi:hypothetical protein